ncbi:MAG: N-acetyltransferase family protein [Candidatus Zixiibacteriota bacterium]|nr:MAG: N-acetyltransferase family protein [candidate division Zixibacteria bacterium]
MPYNIRRAEDTDAPAVARVFNHFVRTGFAAFPSQEVDDSFLDRLRGIAGRFPMHVIESPEGTVVGFAVIRPHHYADTLSRTADATIFILPEHTRQGLGGRILKQLETDARAHAVDTLLGCASSRNEQSIAFQKAHGFVECGRFQRVGHKFNQDFDLVWLQKFL